uniref:Pseudouridine synthase I TruA alpha/beta domain-containing protein n=1 Tax=Solanum lycopersicum TaxID=4081 RepID=A0A3Q7G7G5_SOLLC
MDLVATLQSELETLRSRMKSKEKGNDSVLKNGVLEGHGKKKNKLRDLGYGAMMHHSKRYVALKVMYFGLRFYGFASEAQMDPTVEGELFKALERTRLIFGDKKELQYSRCGRTDKGVSSVGQVIALFLRSNHRESRGDNKYPGENSIEESCGLLISPFNVLLCLAFLIVICHVFTEMRFGTHQLPSVFLTLPLIFFLCMFW